VTAGQTATFSVVASGSAPLSYRWQKNNGTGMTDIANATAATYTTPPTTTSDSGSTFQVMVSNAAGPVTSNTAMLTVNPAKNPIQYETESSTVFNASKSSGPTYRVFAWTGFTDGSGTILDTTKIGDNVTITLNIPQAGTYDVKVAVKKLSTRGIMQLSVNGINVGPAEDQYVSSSAWVEFDVGTVTFSSAGNQPFKFTVVGKNSASSGYSISFDYIKLTPQ
jgi:hypothetical protein